MDKRCYFFVPLWMPLLRTMCELREPKLVICPEAKLNHSLGSYTSTTLLPKHMRTHRQPRGFL